MDALREVGPGSHFLGCAHTRANFESAFWRSGTADNNSFEQWESEGGRDAYQRANGMWKKTLENYEAPAIDPGLDAALKAFIAERTASMPAAFESAGPGGARVLRSPGQLAGVLAGQSGTRRVNLCGDRVLT